VVKNQYYLICSVYRCARQLQRVWVSGAK